MTERQQLSPEEMYEYILKNNLVGDLTDIEFNNIHGYGLFPAHGRIVKEEEGSFFVMEKDSMFYSSGISRIPLENVEDEKEMYGYVVHYGEDEDAPFVLIAMDEDSEEARSECKKKIDIEFIKFVGLDNPRKLKYMTIQARSLRKAYMENNRNLS